MPGEKAQIQQNLLVYLSDIGFKCNLPDKPSYFDSGWVMDMVRNGYIRRGNGEPFPEDISFDQFTDEVIAYHNNQNAVGLYNIHKDQQALMILNNNNKFEPVTVDFVFASQNGPGTQREFKDVAVFLTSDGFSEIYRNGLKSFRHEVPEIIINDENLPDVSCMAYDNIRSSVRDILNELRDTDSFFSSDTEQYKNFKRALENLNTVLNSHGNYFAGNGASSNPLDVSVNFSSINECFQDALGSGAAYFNSKMNQSDLNSRQLDRIGVYAQLRSLGKLVKNAAECEEALDGAPEDEAYEAKEKLNAAMNALRPNELLKDKTAHKTLFGELKALGPKAAYSVLKEQSTFDQELAQEIKRQDAGRDVDQNILNGVGRYDDLHAKLKKSTDFNYIINSSARYGGNTARLKEYSQKSPANLQKKLSERRKLSIEFSQVTNRGRQWKNTEAEKASHNHMMERISLIGNNGLSSVCEYTLKLTDQLVKDLQASESSFHSGAYKAFKSELEGLHNKMLENFNDTIGKYKDGVLKNEQNRKELTQRLLNSITGSLKDAVNAAEKYQQAHLGQTYAQAGQNVAKRLQIASGIKVINDFLTDKDMAAQIINSGDQSAVMENMLKAVCSYRDQVNRMDGFVKAGNVAAVNNKLRMFTDYDSADGLKAAMEAPAEEALREFIRKDPMARLSGVKKTVAQKQEETVKAAEAEKVKKEAEKAAAQKKELHEAVKKQADNLDPADKILREENYKAGRFELHSMNSTWLVNKAVLNIDILGKTIEELNKFSEKYGDYDLLAEVSGRFAQDVRTFCNRSGNAEMKKAAKSLIDLENKGKEAEARMTAQGLSNKNREDSWKVTRSGFEAAQKALEKSQEAKGPAKV